MYTSIRQSYSKYFESLKGESEIICGLFKVLKLQPKIRRFKPSNLTIDNHIKSNISNRRRAHKKPSLSQSPPPLDHLKIKILIIMILGSIWIILDDPKKYFKFFLRAIFSEVHIYLIELLSIPNLLIPERRDL
jgi:hypothetical protein